MKKNTTPVSDAISQISFVGNITPSIWYQKIKGKAKKTKHGTVSQTADLLAISILSDIVYWYRNIEVRDEKTGAIIEVKKKFASDKLQKSYQSYADFFGVTKDDVTDAVTNLVNLGLIEREYRTVIISGVPHNNVVFLSPVPNEVLKLTHSIEVHPIPQLTPPYTSIEGEGVGQLTGTNTETTPKTTPESIKEKGNERKSEISFFSIPNPKTHFELSKAVFDFLNQQDDEIAISTRRDLAEFIQRKCEKLRGKNLTIPQALKEVIDWWSAKYFSDGKAKSIPMSGFIGSLSHWVPYYDSYQPDEKKYKKDSPVKTSGSTIRTQYDEEGNVIPRTKTSTI